MIGDKGRAGSCFLQHERGSNDKQKPDLYRRARLSVTITKLKREEKWRAREREREIRVHAGRERVDRRRRASVLQAHPPVTFDWLAGR